jgi:hypothetical protein
MRIVTCTPRDHHQVADRQQKLPGSSASPSAAPSLRGVGRPRTGSPQAAGTLRRTLALLTVIGACGFAVASCQTSSSCPCPSPQDQLEPAAEWAGHILSAKMVDRPIAAAWASLIPYGGQESFAVLRASGTTLDGRIVLRVTIDWGAGDTARRCYAYSLSPATDAYRPRPLARCPSGAPLFTTTPS